MANPNPVPRPENLTPYQPGQSGNPGGKTAEHRRLEVDSAERAARIRNRILAAKEQQIVDAEAEGDAVAVAMLTGDMLRMLADAEDRGFGKPTQGIDHRSPDGSMSPQGASTDAALAAMRRKHGATEGDA